MKLSYFLSLSFLLISNPTKAQQNFWEPSNGPSGDWISGIVVNSNNHIFASTLSVNSMYFTSNSGENWTIRNDGLPSSTSINSIVINQDDYVFAGTRTGLYRSTNNGGNWNEVFDKSIRAMELDESDYIYACDFNSGYEGSWSNLYRSTDQGISWQGLLYGEFDNLFF